MKAAEYLDEAKKALLLSSDYALAQKLGFAKQHISRWRKGIVSPDTFACTVLAKVLKLDPMTVISDIQAQAETNPERAEFWREYLNEQKEMARQGVPSDRVVGREWLEHSTYGLRVRCSTN